MTILVENLRALVRDDDEAVFEDEALEQAIAAAGDNILRAAGIAFLSLAAEYSQIGRSTKTADLAIDTKGRGPDLASVANSFFAQANASDSQAGSDYVDVIAFSGRKRESSGYVVPEATPWPVIC